MNEIETLYCIGCGAQLQADDQQQAGYIPANTLAKYLKQSATQDLYCQRCFRLRHYNEVSQVPIEDAHFKHLLAKIGHEQALVVYVVDLFNFSGSVIQQLKRYIGNNPVLLVGNKADLIPSSFNRNKLKNWLQHQAKILGLQPLDIELVSAKKLTNIDQLLVKISQLRKNRDVYVVGTTNVGKSTLINAIIRSHSGWQDLITTSNFPGTTLNEIRLPLADGGELIDTPGIVHKNQISQFLSRKELKYIAPQSEIHPRIFQLQAQQTLFLAGLARLDFISGPAGSFVVYVDNNLYVHRTKLQQADEFYQKHLGELLTPPVSAETFPPLQSQTITTKEKSDIVFSGLGWIAVPEQVQVKAYLPQGLQIEVRSSLIN
ncbi:ribosome biogenesis GTPase YqeH [Bombilactobacillus bombi]|uniref:Ribosome biogenesis GTPase YqeH n=1 Tax=Bombilactobacillus bombi TaxID=1303590 RepID=A0A347SQI2_9LACO|nr:ribosome biogenesis GTPase YqeH [Bombilactobacillus bombi]AXX64291.1 ribosome biogenesis GTPase YqeH [Bombilactobacillus bombi]RHW49589.1 ribosome biogenesis GTPase YqeH [Bombilactobacillus bombi]